ncbi:sugar phosphate isomerase/epimerase family protein [Anaeromicropila herbilytica]|uniref:Xylose isomerase-like TIM barrel domain-containing protein n=1 Tax=Anaeromicropila herbilytica TaxID=2785025 RepID=A0A7R7EJV7_9FIRM|nr:sugar phosphate isomerase/epimerase [Anaeromicropila herbilytica]BCN30099.1 hypothetical protein bsdtb5_13940 [Anaeromicropila herbilytica]
MKLSVFYEHITEAVSQTGKSMEEILAEVAKAGIRGVEIEDRRLMNEEECIMRQLRKKGMEVNCIYGFFDFGNHPEIDKGMTLLDMAGRVGAKKVLVIPGFIREGEDRELALENMKNVLAVLCREAENRGIQVGMEDFDDSIAPFATTKQLLWFMENVPGLTCTFDTGNFLYSEEDALDAFEALRPHIASVHCKDRSLEYKEGEEAKITIQGRRLYSSAVGSGCIPMKEIVSELLQKGYESSFAIEHFGSMNQLEDMKASAKWLLHLELSIKSERNRDI